MMGQEEATSCSSLGGDDYRLVVENKNKKQPPFCTFVIGTRRYGEEE